MILPKKDAFLKKSLTNRETFMLNKEGDFPYDIEISLVRLIEREIELTNNMNYCIYNVRIRNDFNFIYSFTLLDENKLNYITQNKYDFV